MSSLKTVRNPSARKETNPPGGGGGPVNHGKLSASELKLLATGHLHDKYHFQVNHQSALCVQSQLNQHSSPGAGEKGPSPTVPSLFLRDR